VPSSYTNKNLDGFNGCKVPSRCIGNFLQVLDKLESRLQTVDSARLAFLGKPFTIAFSWVLKAGNTIGTLKAYERNAAKCTMKLGQILCMN
jgi:hypothetical protein